MNNPPRQPLTPVFRCDPVHAPNSKAGPQADPSRTAEALWYTDGEMVRTAYTLRPEDDDWGKAGTLGRDAMDDAERDRLASHVAGHLRSGVSEPVLVRAFERRKNINKETGDRIEAACTTDPHDQSSATRPREGVGVKR